MAELDAGRAIPVPDMNAPAAPGEISSLVVIDFEAYRRVHDLRTVRKSIALPSWLNALAEDAGINFSQVIQDAFKQKLNVQDRP